jgi:putative restriction endonuclease
MRGYVGITDGDWFRFLRGIGPEEVNFWQPGGSTGFRRLSEGEPFFFKLHAPDNFIVGGGFFAHFSHLPCSLAWEAFGQMNGAPTFAEMRRRIEKYRRIPPQPHEDYTIGCIILTSPFFFERPDWISVPSDFSLNIVQGKGYDLRSGEGQQLWEQCRLAIRTASPPAAGELLAPMYGDPVPVRPRLGQGSFRVLVTDVYERRCAITRERVLPVLEAAHIRPVSDGGRHEIGNGLLLRSDLHRLFDRGYVTVTPDHRFRVSRGIKKDFDNGEEYYQLDGAELWLPRDHGDRPRRDFLEWHSDTVFRA